MFDRWGCIQMWKAGSQTDLGLLTSILSPFLHYLLIQESHSGNPQCVDAFQIRILHMSQVIHTHEWEVTQSHSSISSCHNFTSWATFKE